MNRDLTGMFSSYFGRELKFLSRSKTNIRGIFPTDFAPDLRKIKCIDMPQLADKRYVRFVKLIQKYEAKYNKRPKQQDSYPTDKDSD